MAEKKNEAVLIFVGTELLRGRLNTYVPALAGKLAALGVTVCGERQVPDSEAAIARAVRDGLDMAPVVIVTGGLGPTFDDLSREGAARALGRGLVFSPALLKTVKARFARFRRPMPEENRRQAMLIKGAKSLPNPSGTAPGQMVSFSWKGAKRLLVLLPGPLPEWEPMFDKYAAPAVRRLAGRSGGSLSFRVCMAGIGESAADEKLAGVMASHPGTEFTILSSPGNVTFSAMCPDKKSLAAIRGEVYSAVGEYVYGEGEDTLEASVGRVLAARKLTLACAESCTGGLLSHRITEVAGSSAYFKGTVVSYANEAKINMLGVKRETLRDFGAVSSRCAVEMASGVRRALGADVGVSVTGIAGPGGATPGKPVGLVYIAVSGPGGDVVREFHFGGTRTYNKMYSAANALHLLLRSIS